MQSPIRLLETNLKTKYLKDWWKENLRKKKFRESKKLEIKSLENNWRMKSTKSQKQNLGKQIWKKCLKQKLNPKYVRKRNL